MSNDTIGQDEPDLKAIDEYLMSDESPENCMQLSDLDGFLTAIVVGPELIQPSALAATLSSHFRRLIDRELPSPLPMV